MEVSVNGGSSNGGVLYLDNTIAYWIGTTLHIEVIFNTTCLIGHSLVDVTTLILHLYSVQGPIKYNTIDISYSLHILYPIYMQVRCLDLYYVTEHQENYLVNNE